MHKLENAKISNILKVFTGYLVGGVASNNKEAFDFSERNKDKAQIRYTNTSFKDVILPSLNDIKTGEFDKNVPAIRNILIQFGTFFIRNDRFKNDLVNALGKVTDENVFEITDAKYMVNLMEEVFKKELLDFEAYTELIYGIDMDTIHRGKRIEIDNYQADGSLHTLGINDISYLIENLKNELDELVSNYPLEIINSPDFLTEVAIKQMEEEYDSKSSLIISDSRLPQEELAVRNIYPSMPNFVIVPIKDGKPNLKNLDELMKAYITSTSIETFSSKLTDDKLVMPLEEYSSLLVIHSWAKKHSPKLVNTLIEKEMLEKNLGVNNVVIENKYGDFDALHSEAVKIFQKINNNNDSLRYSMFSSISGGGKDTFMEIFEFFMQERNEEEADLQAEGLNETFKKCMKYIASHPIDSDSFDALYKELNTFDLYNSESKDYNPMNLELFFSTNLKEIFMDANKKALNQGKSKNKGMAR